MLVIAVPSRMLPFLTVVIDEGINTKAPSSRVFINIFTETIYSLILGSGQLIRSPCLVYWFVMSSDVGPGCS